MLVIQVSTIVSYLDNVLLSLGRVHVFSNFLCKLFHTWTRLIYTHTNKDPTSTGTNLYYADGSSCVKDADTCSSSERCGRATIEKTLHPDVVTCCSESLSWVKDEYCQTRSIGTYVEKWFVTSGKCSKDCDPTTGEPCADVPNTSTSMEFFMTVEECCSTKLTYLDAEECKILSEGSSTTTGSTTVSYSECFWYRFDLYVSFCGIYMYISDSHLFVICVLSYTPTHHSTLRDLAIFGNKQVLRRLAK